MPEDRRHASFVGRPAAIILPAQTKAGALAGRFTDIAGYKSRMGPDREKFGIVLKC